MGSCSTGLVSLVLAEWVIWWVSWVGCRNVPSRIELVPGYVAVKLIIKSRGGDVRVQSLDWPKCALLHSIRTLAILLGQSTFLLLSQALGLSSGFAGIRMCV